jgi:AcrR family transcriptional regulator
MAAKRKNDASRDAVRTRAALIDAARWLLTRKGYDQVGVRDIAARAHVDAALVQRYFGSKKHLFEEAVRGAFDAEPLLAQSAAGPLGARLARILLEPTKDRASFDATLVVLRSAASEQVRTTLALGLQSEFITPLAKALGGGNGKRARAAAVLAVLAGFDMVRTVLGIEDLDEPEARRLLATLLDVCLEG